MKGSNCVIEGVNKTLCNFNSCLNCGFGSESIYDKCRTCTNIKSDQYGHIVDERDICTNWKENR